MATPPEVNLLERHLSLVGDVRYRTDASGRIMEISGAHEEVLGYSAESLEGAHYLVFLDSDVRNEAYRFYSEQAKQLRTLTDREFPAVTRKGKRIWVRLIAQLIEEAGTVRGFEVVVRDVSHRHELAAEADQTTARLSLIQEAARGGDIPDVLRRALSLLEADLAVLSRLSGDQAHVVVTVPEDTDPRPGRRLPLSESLSGLVAASGSMIVIGPRAGSEHAFHPTVEWPESEACMSAPIRCPEGITGTLSFFRAECPAEGWTPVQQQFVELLTTVIGIRLDSEAASRSASHAQESLELSWDLVSEGLISCDQDGTISSANPAALEIFGWAKPPIGRELRHFLPDFSRRRSGRQIAIRADGEEVQAEVTSQSAKSGLQVVTITRTRDKDRHRLLTLRKEAITQALLSSVTAPAGVLAMRDGQLTHLSANHAAQAFFDLLNPGPKSTLTGSFDEAGVWEAACGRCMARDESVTFQVGRSGRTLEVTISQVDPEHTSSPVFTYISREITAQRTAVAERAALEAERTALLTLLPDAVVVSDANAHILSASAAFSRLFGYDQDRVSGLSLKLLMPDREASTLSAEGVRLCRHMDGSEFMASWYSAPLHDGSNRTVSVVRDVSADMADRNRTWLLERVMREVDSPLILTDPEGTITFANQAAGRSIGPQAETVGTNLADLGLRPEPFEGGHVPCTLAAPPSEPTCGRLSLRSRQGDQTLLEVRYQSVCDQNQNLIAGVLMALDVTREVAALNEAEHVRHTDPLTGAANRAALLERLADSTTAFSLIVLDLDGFGQINRELGIDAGDELLALVAGALNGFSSDTSHCLTARLQADMFALLMRGGRTEAELRQVHEKLVRVISEPQTSLQEVAPEWPNVTASFGATVWEPVAGDSDRLGESEAGHTLNQAELALEQARRAGPGTMMVYSARMGHDLRRAASHRKALRSALQDEQLQVLYEPVVSLADGGLIGFQAEVFWQEPDGSLAPVSGTLRSLGDPTLARSVDAWSAQHVSTQLGYWREAYRRPNLKLWVRSSGASTNPTPDGMTILRWDGNATAGEPVRDENGLEQLRSKGQAMGMGPLFSAPRTAAQAEKLFSTPGWLVYWGDRPPTQRSTTSPNSGMDIRS